ncbi:hypothetical protein C2S52_022563 [Perilla frutescens var. hirtella]|nr:hypothetical protein C2S52_022563 [Perilla frutescens var. hirtella]KAH6807062.1 hypothetical protein C2S51_028170 [Perilla frutescens var. frutescens]
MAFLDIVDSSQELLDAQAHVWNHTFSYVNSMCLRCAIQLGIPDIIHEHDKPITLSQLVDALPMNKAKSHGLNRLMRILVHSKIFEKVNISEEEEEEAYSLTTASRLLLRDEPLSFAPFVLAMIDPIQMYSFHHLFEWFNDESPSPFHTKNGKDFWELAANEKKWNQVFNEAMASDARFVGSILVKECKHLFEGLNIVVDVAGGTGMVAKALADSFPSLKSIVLDLPHVVAGLEASENLRFVSGDMFQFIPPADAVLLKWILHNWSDEDCVKILEKCKEAIIPSRNNGGKVIILDMIVDGSKEKEKEIETQLHFDMIMMTFVTGKERSEKEWASLFFAAGFNNYKITPILGLRSVIEVFP